MHRMFLLAIGLVVLGGASRRAAALPKCADPSSPVACPHWPKDHPWPRPGVELVHLRVLPHDTDKGIRIKDLKDRTPYHVIYRRSDQKPNGHLLVFLPGSGGIPEAESSEFFVQLAAWQGYHAIGLVYVNDHEIGPATGSGIGSGALCTQPQGLDCFGEKCLENLEGKPGSSYVDPPNSVQNRLVKLLMWLKVHDPDADWGQFLDGGRPKWESIAFAGHSQGGGLSAFIGVKHKVHRVASLSSPAEGFDSEIAPWQKEKPATPPERFYGFANRDDPRFVRIPKVWAALGLPGGLEAPLAMGQKPKRGIHQVTTQGTSDPHNSVMQDGFSEVWLYLMGE